MSNPLPPSKFKTNLERWRYFLQDYEAPDIFINWTFYAMISAALQRRVCLNATPQSFSSAPNAIYPNLFVIFIAEPGVGKSQTANQAKYMFQQLDRPDSTGNIKQVIKRGPDSITLEALTRYLHNHYTTTKIPEEIAGSKGKVYTHSSLALFCGDELGAMLKENTQDLVTFLNIGWDAGDFHRETKTQGIDIVKNMCITLLGAATPAWVKSNVSSAILNEGFSARAIFVYASRKRHLKFRYNITADQRAELQHVSQHIEKLSTLFGEVKVPQHVDDWTTKWYEKENSIPMNNSRLLKPYYERKKTHLQKLSLCMHFSDSLSMELTLPDVQRALEFLNLTELEMDKALNQSGSNPIYSIATGILTYLEKKAQKKEHHNQIVVDFYNEGNMEQLTEALQFLCTTGKITSTTVGNKLWYQIKQIEGDDVDEQPDK